jgi:hypothetical protein
MIDSHFEEETTMRLARIFSLFIAVFAFALMANSQTAPESGDVAIGGAELPMQLPAPHAKAGIVSMRVDNMEAEPIKGAPFCATVTTEHTQAFADGNRIHTTDNSTLCRDSEGRIRREAELNLLGAAQERAAPKLITIIDPVAGYRYMLDSENKIAHKIPIAAPASGIGTAGLSPKKT